MSIRKLRLGPVSVLDALSLARTWTVYCPSAGKLEAGNVYDQLPAEKLAAWKSSEPEEKALPFQ